MKAKSFILSLVTLLFSVFTLYFFFIDHLLSVDRIIPESYKHFLLENTTDLPGNKIYILGGSDAHHGINALMLEEAFKRPVINHAENGGYQLKYKVYNIMKYVQPGDAVILSLAWGYYKETKELRNNFVEAISDKNGIYSFYYKNLPLTEKLIFSFNSFPLKTLLQRLLNDTDTDQLIIKQYNSEEEIYRKISSSLSNTRGSSISNNKNIENYSPELTCDYSMFKLPLVLAMNKEINTSHTIARKNLESLNIMVNNRETDRKFFRYLSGLENSGISINLKNAELSATFLETLRLVDQLKSQGIQVFFSWPILVDSDSHQCYSSKFSIGIDEFAKKISEEVTRHGFSFLGDYKKSHFPSSCFLDSYAHITSDCANIMTRNLISELNKSNLLKNNNSSYRKEQFDKHLKNNLSVRGNILDDYVSKSKFDNLRKLPDNFIIKNENKSTIAIGSGWSNIEDWGIWSLGHKSRLYFRINDNIYPKNIIINGQYFNIREKTRVYINSRYIGKYFLENATIVLPDDVKNSKQFTLRLEHISPISPRYIDKNTDDYRRIKFGLKSIGII